MKLGVNAVMARAAFDMDDDLEGDQGKGGWTTLQKIVKS